MATILEPADLTPFADIDTAKAEAMVTHVLALASRVAPCLTTTADPSVIGAAKALLVNVVLDWHESGTASYQATMGVAPGTILPQRRSGPWLSDAVEEKLQQLCLSATASSSVYSISLAPDPVV